MTTINVKYLEFGEVCLDLRHVRFSRNPQDDHPDNKEFIVFLNVYKAFFCNFKIVSDLSLETLTHFIYENVKFVMNGVVQDTRKVNYEHFIISEPDRERSIIIEFNKKARIVVAETIRFDEQYHQRVSGYIDFEHRHQPLKNKKRMTTQERAEFDKECEIKLLEYT
ncbi:ORF-40 [Buzura suppressaria nucleopolyhedrovirus]|uniref:ORF-40 n=1 Tax=Buzura suppressaria nuclear polyhedrosis virus TaxID=74320 RepID=W5VL17_NPVBS|nr:ORF-40 [Buzura suppressaria nucleopolyhedrovirus]AHH82629.1 ORF-40 [Buzura suppressaria nucleopolyhedrovirus]QYF10607.1 hypothetical protein [Buzura suppressaria nucleopolyhedrovirus]